MSQPSAEPTVERVDAKHRYEIRSTASAPV